MTRRTCNEKTAVYLHSHETRVMQTKALQSGHLLLLAMVACSAVVRGTTIQEHIVIGTPGTVLDWGLKLKIFDPKKIRVFVLDEADVMIATQGHQDQSIRIQRQAPTPQHKLCTLT